MYKVCGNTNYECTTGEEQIFSDELCLEDAIKLFLSLSSDIDSLDFGELDALIDDWADTYCWDEEDYYSGSYGGAIYLYDAAINASDFDREIVFLRIERDPLKKENTLGCIEFGAEITTQEKNVFLSLSKK